MSLDFTAIDFETANSSSASACAVGLVRVRDGRIVARAGWLIQPPPGHDRFFEINIGIHGIHPHQVLGARTWSAQLADLAAFAGADVLVAHNAGFDMAVLRRACEATGDDCPPYRYLCSLQVARRTYQLPSYRLPRVAAEAGFFDFPHHDATADATACAHIIIDVARRLCADDIDTLAEYAGARVSRIATAEPARAELVTAELITAGLAPAGPAPAGQATAGPGTAELATAGLAPAELATAAA